ncbi:PspA/IM30 family protein [Paenibacillus tengchongensis]|uniref:PspA/IM30 family protein n=1 Tax=Paenibacillus tengchongensis TaxID=2608684 RepID=UPI00124D1D9E|nr:PspA/IM30 family protein [Paenibacillus tengchongensis]
MSNTSIFQRIATLTKAAIHEGLNKLEDPVLLTGQYLRDLEEKIENAENKQRQLQASANVLERRIAEYHVQAQHSESGAVKAMSEGNEAAARTAVLAKLQYTESAEEAAANLERTRQTLAALEVDLAAAKEEHVRLKAKRAELAERARKAEEAVKASSRNASGAAYPGTNTPVIHAGAASRGFERMEDKISEWEAQAERSGAAVSPGLDPALHSAVDAELERLRKKAGN